MATSGHKGTVKTKKVSGGKSPWTNIQPMLATLVDKPFDREGWSYEIKWDGYRALTFVDEGEVEIKSRNDKSFNEKFYSIYDEIKKWKMRCVLDGEIVVLNDKGIS